MLAQNEHAAPVGLDLAGRGAPDASMPSAAACCARCVGIHMGGDIGLLAVLLGVALQDGVRAGHRRRQAPRPRSPRPSCASGVVQALEDTQSTPPCQRTGIGREAEQDDPDLLLGSFALRRRRRGAGSFPQGCRSAPGRAPSPCCRSRRGSCRAPLQPSGDRAPAENGRVRRAVDLGQRDQHRRLDRAKPTVGVGPLTQRLKLQRMRGDIGHVEPFSTSTAASLSL
jgi:hypothetical protein